MHSLDRLFDNAILYVCSKGLDGTQFKNPTIFRKLYFGSQAHGLAMFGTGYEKTNRKEILLSCLHGREHPRGCQYSSLGNVTVCI